MSYSIKKLKYRRKFLSYMQKSQDIPVREAIISKRHDYAYVLSSV